MQLLLPVNVQGAVILRQQLESLKSLHEGGELHAKATPHVFFYYLQNGPLIAAGRFPTDQLFFEEGMRIRSRRDNTITWRIHVLDMIDLMKRATQCTAATIRLTAQERINATQGEVTSPNGARNARAAALKVEGSNDSKFAECWREVFDLNVHYTLAEPETPKNSIHFQVMADEWSQLKTLVKRVDLSSDSLLGVTITLVDPLPDSVRLTSDSGVSHRQINVRCQINIDDERARFVEWAKELILDTRGEGSYFNTHLDGTEMSQRHPSLTTSFPGAALHKLIGGISAKGAVDIYITPQSFHAVLGIDEALFLLQCGEPPR
eukprot:Blabericola_migrator_1__10004@NODE_553_length_7646_cov_26_017417_g416_i0_p2_GENE_NODE_553_length_7646_cov_26_017417_g416_i0NODE_553_length_7646_cov_26_017417_g416_i0_p2_ORF_typecomplete_len320_score69_70Hus1/PF04005_12/6_6e07_NODE_553_length_7646_cov_26_017417_g416_i066377596